MQEAIVTKLKLGHYPEVAAVASGISKGCFYEWMKRGRRQRNGKYRKFYDAVKKAVAEAQVMTINIVQKAALKSWTAAAWTAERRWPELWGRRDAKELKDLKSMIVSLEEQLRAITPQTPRPQNPAAACPPRDEAIDS
jgi:hypothetical protein